MQNNYCNSLIASQVQVDEQVDYEAMEAAYYAMLEAMHEPDIIISSNASEEQARLVNDINWVLNGCEHKLEKPIILRSNVDFIECERIIYRERKLYADRYDMKGDYWERILLDTIVVEDLYKLYKQLIDEIF